jgi:hypothetical protein
MRPLLATWILFRVGRGLLPEGHPWKRPRSLREWNAGATPLLEFLDFNITVSTLALLAIATALGWQ